MNKKKKIINSTIDIVLVGMMVAVIEVCKVALMGLPNIELTSFWIIMFTLFLKRRIFFVIPVFTLIEGTMFGFSIWWIMYIYVWPLLAVFTWIFRKQSSVWFWSIFSAVFGLFFGVFCSFPYAVTGMLNGGLRSGLYAGFTWWIAGVPYDLAHCIGNFVIMFLLHHPIRRVMSKSIAYVDMMR